MNRRQLIQSIAGTGCLLGASESITAHAAHESSQSKISRSRQNYLDTDAGQLHYWTAGSGENLVLVHQSGNSSAEFAGLVPYLKDHFRMIVIDLPGHGKSYDPDTQPTVEDYSTAVEQVMDHLKITRASILGHHGGSVTVLNLVANQPERFRKTILSGLGGLKSPEESQKFLDSLLEVDTSVRKETEFMGNAWDRYINLMSDNADAKDMLQPFIEFLQSRQRPYRAIVTYLSWQHRATSVEKLEGPVLLVQGGKDAYVTGQEMLLDIIPQSTRIIMEECGVFMFYDKTEECADMIKAYLI